MPRPQVIFTEAMDSDDSSDDEVVFVPYTKPPPLVIELDSDSQSAIDVSFGEDTNKSPPKKKGKKEKRKRTRRKDKELDSTDLANDASPGNPTSSQSPSLSSGNCGQSGKTTENCSTRSNSCGENEEPVASSLQKKAQGSRNVASNKNTSSVSTSGEVVRATPTPVNHLDGVVGTENGSSLEKCVDAQSHGDNGGNVGTGMGLPMAESSPASAQGKDKNKKPVKSKERKSTGKSPRTRTLSATQRTNEEIVNFLTTLGIQMEPSSFDSPIIPPPKRKRQPKNQTQPSPVVPENDSSMDSTATSTDGQTFPLPLDKSTPAAAFVSVTQDAGTPTTSSPRKKRRRQAISGDLSEFSVSFTQNDLNTLNTSFQSNLVTSAGPSGAGTDPSRFLSVSNEKSSRKSGNYYETILDSLKGPTTKSAVEPNCTVSSTTEETVSAPVANLGICHGEEASSSTATAIDNDGKAPDHREITENAPRVEIEVQKENVEEAHVEPEAVVIAVVDKSTPDDDEDDGLIIDESVGMNVARDSDPAVVSPSNKSVPLDDISVTVVTVESRNDNTNNKRKRTEDEIINETEEEIVVINCDKNPKSRPNKKSRERKRQRWTTSEASSSAEETPVKRKDKGKSRREDFGTDSSRHFHGRTSEAVSESEQFVPHEPFFPTTWSSQMRGFYGTETNVDMEVEDVQASQRSARRLWEAPNDMMPPPGRKNRHVRCEKCKQVGHFARECTEKRKPLICHYCGKTGHTSDSHGRHRRPCPSTLCLNCGSRMPKFTQKCSHCLLRNHPVRCTICNVIGHDQAICPDNWRRYHAVTSNNEFNQAILKIKPSQAVPSYEKLLKSSTLYQESFKRYCANCGRRGHLFYDCRGSKFNDYPRYKPTIINEIVMATATPAAIPLSYDSRTGRTIVVDADGGNQPEIAVETIRVQITNELAIKNAVSIVPSTTLSSESPANTFGSNLVVDRASSSAATIGNMRTVIEDLNTVGMDMSIGNDLKSTFERGFRKYRCETTSCTNKLGCQEKCYVMKLSAEAHFKLLSAYRSGVLKHLEVQHLVQICVIEDNCRVHIVGDNAIDSSVDLNVLLANRIDISRVQISRALDGTQQERKEITDSVSAADIEGTESSRGGTTMETEDLHVSSGPGDSRDVEIVTVDDDDNDIVEIEILEPSGSAGSKSNKKTNQSDFNSQNRKTSESSATVNAPGVTQIKTPNNENLSEVNQPGPSSSFSAYVSPLTGLSLNNEVDVSSKTTENDLHHNASSDQRLANERSDAMATVFERDRAPSFELEDIEEIDYADAENGSNNVPAGSNTGKKISNTETNEVSSSDDVEVITLEDDDSDIPSQSQSVPSGPSPKRKQSVPLLPAELEMAFQESLKLNSVFHQIADAFDVRIHVSKEDSALIIEDGNNRSRQSVSNEIVCWLESKSQHTEYHFVPPKSMSVNDRYIPKKNQGIRNVANLNDIRGPNMNYNPTMMPPLRKKKWRSRKFNGKMHNRGASSSSSTGPDTPRSNSHQSPSNGNLVMRSNPHFNQRGRGHFRPYQSSRHDNRNTPSSSQNHRRVRYFDDCTP